MHILKSDNQGRSERMRWDGPAGGVYKLKQLGSTVWSMVNRLIRDGNPMGLLRFSCLGICWWLTCFSVLALQVHVRRWWTVVSVSFFHQAWYDLNRNWQVQLIDMLTLSWSMSKHVGPIVWGLAHQPIVEWFLWCPAVPNFPSPSVHRTSLRGEISWDGGDLLLHH